MEEFFLKNSPYIFLAYIVLKEMFPIISKLTEMLVPARIARWKTAEEKLVQLKEQDVELEAKRLDLKEREVVAMEQIGKSVAITDIRLTHIETLLNGTTSTMASMQQALIILLERNRMIRKEDSPLKQTAQLTNIEVEEPR